MTKSHGHSPNGMMDREAVETLAQAVLNQGLGDGAEQHEKPAQWLKDSLTSERAGPEPSGFIPRDPMIARLQAAYDETAARRGVSGAPIGEWWDPADEDDFVEGMSSTGRVDPYWSKSFLELAFRHLLGRIRFNRLQAPPRITPLAEDARVILVGDWGTGQKFAKKVSDRISRSVEEAGSRQTHVVHLGDVYYAGTQWEAENRFLAHWPVALDRRADTSSWCLNGNHDMYAAGEGLFNSILRDARFSQQTTDDLSTATSELHLRNDNWQFIGLDTSWEYRTDDFIGSHGHLSEKQKNWWRHRIGDGTTPRTVFLSHHPAFEVSDHGEFAISHIGEVARTIMPPESRIEAWFWGHNHRLITYVPPSDFGIDYAVCTGHGAVPKAPETPDDDVPGKVKRFTATTTDRDGEVWYKCGFTVLDLKGAQIEVKYVDLDGNIWQDTENSQSRRLGPE